jgi:hypothetical protein
MFDMSRFKLNFLLGVANLSFFVVDIEFRSNDVSIRTTKSNCIKLLGVTNMDL